MGTKEDLAFAAGVSAGDINACTRFIDEYTDLVLSRVWQLSKTHCHYTARNSICSLLILQRQRKGSANTHEDQCDQCMDSYLWFFEILKKKIKNYEGRNKCTLSTFVWSVANSDFTKKDWLRWKYKRCDRPPVCIEKLDRIYHKIYEYLCERKSEDEISRLLNISMDDVSDKIHKVKTELIRAGQIDLVESFKYVSINGASDEQEFQLPSGERAQEEKSIDKQHISIANNAINELPAHQLRLFRLYYKGQMSAKDILVFFKKMAFSPIPDKDISKLTEQDIYYEINKGMKEVQAKIKEQ